MRKFSDIAFIEEGDGLQTDDDALQVDQNDEHIPDYMLTDPEFVGYPSTEIQEAIYEQAWYGTANPVLNDTILDVGCGRGDFGHYLTAVAGFDSSLYTGIDSNEINVEIAKKKYGDINVWRSVWLYDGELPWEDDIKLPNTYDWVYHINTYNIDYNRGLSNENKYEKLVNIINQSMNVANKGSVLILLAEDREPVDERETHIKYDIGTVVQIANKLNLRYQIHRDIFENIFKLTFFNTF